MCDFVHLHNHSHYSLQDGASTVQSLIKYAGDDNQNAIALTDHGVMYGVSEFSKTAKKAGIKPIIGMEAYIVKQGSRFEKGSVDANGKLKSRSEDYHHLLLLVKNEIGYKNLTKLSSIGHTEGFYYKPRIDLEVLKKYSEGLICTSACLKGPVAEYLVKGDYNTAKENALKFFEIFNEDFYLEIQDHGLPDDKPVLELMPKLSNELGIKMIASNDIHYVEQEHAYAHNILINLGDKTGNVDWTDLRYQTNQLFFKTTEQMKKLFKDYKGAIENTLEITEKIDFKMKFGEYHFPVFPIPKELGIDSLNDYFEYLAKEGLNKRFKKVNKEILDRFEFEVKTIKDMGYSGYFLITQDFINAAKNKGIPVGPGRGSAAGSLVAYVLGITDVNPLEYDLLFERFLNPDRQSMPDIDVDFADDQREDVIEYTKNKYGKDAVCQIITFNKLSSKQVLKDVARVLNIPLSTVEKINKYIPSKFGKVYSIDQAINEVPELNWLKDTADESIQNLLKFSRILEGMNRNASKHAAGVVIAPGDVSNYVPLAVAGGASGDIVTQFNMGELEEAGLLKMDFLGLRTLTIIRDTIELVKKTNNIEILIEDIPTDDSETYELFSKGQTTAIFQFESPNMREYLKRLQPSDIRDLAAMNALYRPGPMEFIDDFIERKHGRKQIEYLHPLLEPILKETNGIIVFQEQVMKIANVVSGFTLAEADLLRRAMGKKNIDKMNEVKPKFISGAVSNGVPESIAGKIWDDLFKFANYGFNKSHSVAYSLVAYQTAYLKAHFLPEFLAANLTNEFGNAEKVTKLLEDCRRMHVEVIPPDVNNPSVKFNVVDGKIVFGMAAIKNVGINAIEEIKKSRKELGRNYRTIFDFCSNVDTRVVNKRTLEGLVLSGAFDKIEKNRNANFEAIETALEFGNNVRNSSLNSTESLFGDDELGFQIEEPSLPKVEEWNKRIRLSKEWEVLGFYLTGHPLEDFETEYFSFADVHLGEQETYNFEQKVFAVGILKNIRRKIDKSKKEMAFFDLDDFTGSCSCRMFSKDFENYKHKFIEEEPVLIKGSLLSEGDGISFNVDEIFSISETYQTFTGSLLIIFNEDEHTTEEVNNVNTLLGRNDGEKQVYFLVKANSTEIKLKFPGKVTITKNLISELNLILGNRKVKLLKNR